MTTYLAHLTDTHVVDPATDELQDVDNNARVAMAVASINAEAPGCAAVIATGDLTQWGTDVEYAQLARLFEHLAPPVLPLPGNHDERNPLRATFPDVPWVDAQHASWVVDIDGVRIVGLDSTVPRSADTPGGPGVMNPPGAEFDDEREAWLRAVLADRHDGPTFLAMHHPPFRTGISWMDANGFVGLDRLADVLAEHRGVDRILCGHLHRPISSTISGIPAEVGLSTTAHVALDLLPEAPVRIIRDPAGYRVVIVERSGSIVVHTRYIDTGESPFPPAWSVER